MLLPAFALVLARVAGLVLAVPMLTSSQVPRMIKVVLIAAISLMIFPLVIGKVPTNLTLTHAAIGLVGEVIIGELLGLAAGVVLFASQLAGQIVSHQAGMSLGQVVNPLFDEETSILDQIWFFATFIIFLALRGHIAVIEVLLGSFNLVPPLGMIVDQSVVDFVTAMLKLCVDMALRLAGPTVIALLLSSLLLGFLTRTLPQLNIFSVGFSLKIAVALIMVAVTLTQSEDLVGRGAADAMDQLGLLMENLSRSAANGLR
jgi:flagellar biosynthetic protein FliR